MKAKVSIKIFVLIVLIILNACQIESNAPDAFELVTLKMNYALVPSYAPIIIAEEEGYFADYGIEIEKVTFNSSVEAVPLVVSGDIDVFAGAASAGILNVLGKEENIKVVADRGHIEVGGCTFQAIVVRKDLFDSGEITKGADLAGHLISTPPTGPGIFFLSQYLQSAGLTLDDVEITDIPTNSYIDAFRNQAVEVIVPTELHLSRLMADGNATILVGSEDVIGYSQTSILAFGKNLLNDHPEIGVRFLAAYLKGVAQYRQGKTERNLQILADATGEDMEILQSSCWLPINADGWIYFPLVDSFQQWSVGMGHMDQLITEEQFWDPSFLEAAYELLGPESPRQNDCDCE